MRGIIRLGIEKEGAQVVQRTSLSASMQRLKAKKAVRPLSVKIYIVRMVSHSSMYCTTLNRTTQ